MIYPGDCMWKDKLCFRFDQRGKVIEAWYTMTCWEGHYCGREIVWIVENS